MLSNIIATKPEDLDLAIGLDIGGTKIKCGIVDINGKIMGTPWEMPTNARGPRERIVTNILELVNQALSVTPENRLRGIGRKLCGQKRTGSGRRYHRKRSRPAGFPAGKWELFIL